MKRMVSIVAGSVALMCGAASVTTATFEDIASDAQVVTGVDLSGLASEGALADAARGVTNYVDATSLTFKDYCDNTYWAKAQQFYTSDIYNMTDFTTLNTKLDVSQGLEAASYCWNGVIHKNDSGTATFLFPDGDGTYTFAMTDAIPDVSKFITADAISATDATFSNAVLAVGLNIDTNTLAAINELATIDYTTPATTVGALLAALAAGLAALKKKTTTIETKVDAANTALEEVA